MSQLSENAISNIDLVKKISLSEFADKPIIAQLCLCQAILESNLQGQPSKLAKVYNNLFGIKERGDKGFVRMATKEQDSSGTISNILAGFGWNSSVEQSVKQYRGLLENGTSDSPNRYRPVLLALTYGQAANQIRLCGWATDINYTNKLIDIHDKYFGD